MIKVSTYSSFALNTKRSIVDKLYDQHLSKSDLKENFVAKKFSDLRTGMSQAARERSDAKAKVMLAEMPLNELRQARGLSQKMLADVLHVQ